MLAGSQVLATVLTHTQLELDSREERTEREHEHSAAPD
jgi:hypothetical protein